MAQHRQQAAGFKEESSPDSVSFYFAFLSEFNLGKARQTRIRLSKSHHLFFCVPFPFLPFHSSWRLASPPVNPSFSRKEPVVPSYAKQRVSAAYAVGTYCKAHPTCCQHGGWTNVEHCFRFQPRVFVARSKYSATPEEANFPAPCIDMDGIECLVNCGFWSASRRQGFWGEGVARVTRTGLGSAGRELQGSPVSAYHARVC